MTTVLSGCGDSVNPSSTKLEIGTYSYTYSSPRPFGGDDLHIPGQLILTYATEDSIAGHWQVAEYQGTAGGGFWDVEIITAERRGNDDCQIRSISSFVDAD